MCNLVLDKVRLLFECGHQSSVAFKPRLGSMNICLSKWAFDHVSLLCTSRGRASKKSPCGESKTYRYTLAAFCKFEIGATADFSTICYQRYG